MPLTEWATALAFLLVYLVEIFSSSIERRRLQEQIVKERAAAQRRESELLDRLMEKEMLSRYAQGIPVPDEVLRRAEPIQVNGAAPQQAGYTGPMDEEIQATIEQMRQLGMPENEIIAELNKVRR